jgi:hypothetical protein
MSQVVRQMDALLGAMLRGHAQRTTREDDPIISKCIFHTRQLDIQENLVFVLMPFTEKWSDYIWKEQIKKVIEVIDFRPLICRRADDLFGHDVMHDIYESIIMARIIIADITSRNANVFYELGLAHAFGKDVILLSQSEEYIPFDLNRFRHCIYSNDGPGYEKLSSFLVGAIKSVLER